MGSQQQEKMPIKALQDVQAKEGFLSEESLRAIAKNLEMPLSQIYGIASFYHQFRLKPVGEFIIYICKGTACHTKSKETLVSFLLETLGIKKGETTSEDGLFTIENARCFGCCSLAPVIMISDRKGFKSQIYGNLTTSKLLSILDEYREEHVARRQELL